MLCSVRKYFSGKNESYKCNKYAWTYSVNFRYGGSSLHCKDPTNRFLWFGSNWFKLYTFSVSLIHWGRVTHLYVSKLSHYLNQCWHIVNWSPGNKLQWNLNRNVYIFFQVKAFQNVVWKMATILSRPQCVRSTGLPRYYQSNPEDYRWLARSREFTQNYCHNRTKWERVCAIWTIMNLSLSILLMDNAKMNIIVDSHSRAATVNVRGLD